MAHGINANVVHRWRIARERVPGAVLQQAEFIELARGDGVVRSQQRRPMSRELQRGPLALRITWPTSAAAGAGRLTREAPALIRVDAIWLAVEPLDMRAGHRDRTGPRR